jgi:hypothetical protein
VHLNTEYVRDGALDVEAMFAKTDCTDEVLAKRGKIEQQMAAAARYLAQSDEPQVGCDCLFKGRSSHCEAFGYSHPHVPAYAVHDIVRIGASKRKLRSLVESRIFAIEEVPDDLELGEAQPGRRASRSGTPIVDRAAVGEILASYRYSLLLP